MKKKTLKTKKIPLLYVISEVFLFFLSRIKLYFFISESLTPFKVTTSSRILICPTTFLCSFGILGFTPLIKSNQESIGDSNPPPAIYSKFTSCSIVKGHCTFHLGGVRAFMNMGLQSWYFWHSYPHPSPLKSGYQPYRPLPITVSRLT